MKTLEVLEYCLEDSELEYTRPFLEKVINRFNFEFIKGVNIYNISSGAGIQIWNFKTSNKNSTVLKELEIFIRYDPYMDHVLEAIKVNQQAEVITVYCWYQL
ncbi:MAG: hypothetical protein ACTSQE_16620 [Candidatus Heimdallarchaeaceae archaeon]